MTRPTGALGRFLRRVAVSVALAAVLGAAGWLVTTVVVGGVDAGDKVASVVGALFAAMPLITTLVVSWPGSSQTKTASPDGTGAATQDRDLWLGDVRQKVRYRWIDDVLHRSLEHALLVKLGLAEQPGAVINPFLPGRLRVWDDAKPLREGTRLTELYDGRASRRLLVLGKPGAGKSTELLHLAEDLLDRADAEPDAPVPVVLQLSARDGTKGALGWVVDQVSSRYEVPADRVEPWLAAGRLVLLLDGLDEITDLARQRDCVASLSALRTEVPVGMVVCCRTQDYQRIGERLQFGLAVTVLPLAPDHVVRYLDAAGDTLNPLRSAVSADPVLAELLDTPLMLGVAALAYQGDHLQEGLLTGNRDERLSHLWDRYVAVMLARRRDPYGFTRARSSPQTTYRHLVWLARAMVQRRRVEIYPDWFGTRWLPGRGFSWPLRAGPMRGLGALLGWRRTATLFAGLAFAMSVGVPLGLSHAVTSGPANVSNLVCGLIYGVSGGLAGGFCYGLSEGFAAIATNLGRIGALWRRCWPAARYAFGGLSCGLAYALSWSAVAAGLFGQQSLLVSDGPAAALASGLLDGVFCGLALRLLGGVLSAENTSVKWRWSWETAGYSLLAGLCSGAVYGLVYGTGSGQVKGLAGAVVAGLVSALGLAVLNGWQPDFSQPPTRPGEALRQTLRTYGTRIAGSLLIAVILCVPLIVGTQSVLPPAGQTLANAIPGVIATGVSAFVFGVGWKGFFPWIDHYAARFIVAWNGFLPRDLVAFLGHCDERILLRRSGGYYLFLHRTLRDHLATCDPRNPPMLTPPESAPDK